MYGSSLEVYNYLMQVYIFVCKKVAVQWYGSGLLLCK